MADELSNMTWWEAQEKFEESRLAIVPVGSVEQHGLHLGLGADWIQAWAIAKRVSEKSGALLLPVQPYGVSGHHKEFPGVITLESTTLQRVIYEILRSLDRYGVDRVVFMNGHGGNLGALTGAAKKARDDFGMLCAVVQWWDILDKKSIHGHPAEEHAGYAETAFMLASRPEAVKLEYGPNAHEAGGRGDPVGEGRLGEVQRWCRQDPSEHGGCLFHGLHDRGPSRRCPRD